MKQPYLQGGALLTACAAGRGAIVVVEGEHRQDDEFFYNQWFGTYGPRISFFAQNGWGEVVDAVADLRNQLSHRAIFGIIDRDFADEASIIEQALRVPPDGIYRTRLYTLENYLLEPEGWHRTVQLLTRGAPPQGWSTTEEIERRVHEAYASCLHVAAWNRTVYDEYRRHPVDGLGYQKHPQALESIDPAGKLGAWGASRRAPRPLDEVFRQHVGRLERADPAGWPVEVTGKAALAVFLRSLGIATSKQVKPEVLCSMYLGQHPAAPENLATIVSTILDAAGT